MKWFVVVVEGEEPVNIVPWAVWIETMPTERPPDSFVVVADDEIDAFIKVKRGELFNI
jgi:hypothetical protein